MTVSVVIKYKRYMVYLKFSGKNEWQLFLSFLWGELNELLENYLVGSLLWDYGKWHDNGNHGNKNWVLGENFIVVYVVRL